VRQLDEMVDIDKDGSQAVGASGLYDGVLSGDPLGEPHASALRTLARVFDLDAGPQVALADLWGRIRPLLMQEARPPK